MAISEIEAYIRQAAVARGIDPDIAVQVALSEGGRESLTTDPYRRSVLSAPGSQTGAGTENSIGPFQLYISGRGAGLGDRAISAGVDPRKDWKAGVDFALNEAARRGWSQWHGWKGDERAGISQNAAPKGVTLTSTPYPAGGAAVVPVGTEQGPGSAPASEPPTSTAAPETPAPAVAATPAEPQGWADKLKALAENKDVSSLGDVLGVSKDKDKSESSSKSELTTGPSLLPQMEGADAARIQAAQALMAGIMAKKKTRRGLTLTGVPNAFPV